MALFGKKKNPTRIRDPFDPSWVRAAKGGFHQLMKLDPDEENIRNVAGVYVIWHGGVRPRWVYVGDTTSIGRAVDEAASNPDITQYEVNGHLFVSWAIINEIYRRGVVLHIVQRVKPLVENSRAPKADSNSVVPVPVYLPGEVHK